MRLRALLLVALAVVLLVWHAVTHRGNRKPDSVAEPVAIEDRKTIDFSSGRPVVKSDPGEQAIIDRAVAQMNAAAGNVTFTPTTTAPTTTGTAMATTPAAARAK